MGRAAGARERSQLRAAEVPRHPLTCVHCTAAAPGSLRPYAARGGSAFAVAAFARAQDRLASCMASMMTFSSSAEIGGSNLYGGRVSKSRSQAAQGVARGRSRRFPRRNRAFPRPRSAAVCVASLSNALEAALRALAGAGSAWSKLSSMVMSTAMRHSTDSTVNRCRVHGGCRRCSHYGLAHPVPQTVAMTSRSAGCFSALDLRVPATSSHPRGWHKQIPQSRRCRDDIPRSSSEVSLVLCPNCLPWRAL